MDFKRIGFSSRQAADIADLPYDSVDHWAKTGFIVPSIAAAKGSGSRRVYSFADLVAFRVACKLRASGIGLPALRRVVAYLERMGMPKPALATTYLVSDGKEVYTRQGDELLALLNHPGKTVFFFVLDLSNTVRELEERIQEVAPNWRTEVA